MICSLEEHLFKTGIGLFFMVTAHLLTGLSHTHTPPARAAELSCGIEKSPSCQLWQGASLILFEETNQAFVASDFLLRLKVAPGPVEALGLSSALLLILAGPRHSHMDGVPGRTKEYMGISLSSPHYSSTKQPMQGSSWPGPRCRSRLPVSTLDIPHGTL